MQYAHTSDAKPFTLRKTWTHPVTHQTHMGMEVRSDEQLAELGLYPVRREPLEPGASGYGEMTLVGNEFVIPSLPGDPVAAHEAYLDTLSCTRLQDRLELIAREHWDAVMQWAENEGGIAQAFFADAAVWRYRDPSFQAGASALGLSDDAQIDMIVSARQR